MTPETGSSRLRILLVTRNLPPLRGGMERLNKEMVVALAQDAELVVVGPVGCRKHLPQGVTVHEVAATPLSKFLIQSLVETHRLARQGFDLALAGSGLTAPAVVWAARRGRMKSAAYVHGLDIVASHPVYRMLWPAALRRLDGAIANSTNTADLARRAGVARGNICIVHPGAVVPGCDVDAGDFRERFRLGDGPLLLSVGRLTERKGIAEFVACALPAIVARHPRTKLVLVGDDAPDALRKSARNPSIALADAIKKHGLADHVVRLGPCDDATLAQAYAAADAHVFPVRRVSGDIEGFGMVAIEAAAHGLATVAFSEGGVPDAVRNDESGWLVEPGDYVAFAEKVMRVLASGRGEPSAASARKFAAGFAWPVVAERMRAAVRRIVDASGQPSRERHGHPVLDLESRKAKATKIERLLDMGPSPRPLRLLEIGCGTGGISHYFAHHPDLRCQVEAVDVSDARRVFDGYGFRLVHDTTLPFPDGAFDVVITNHVIEHVGDVAAQRHHLEEVRRVLATGGKVYLAVPNRWMLIEPHYRVAFLSWLPERWRTPYLRWRRRGTEYDCRPLTVAQVESLLGEVGFIYEQVHGRALKLTYELERPSALVYRACFRHVPDAVYRLARRAFPTLIYTLASRSESRAASVPTA